MKSKRALPAWVKKKLDSLCRSLSCRNETTVQEPKEADFIPFPFLFTHFLFFLSLSPVSYSFVVSLISFIRYTNLSFCI